MPNFEHQKKIMDIKNQPKKKLGLLIIGAGFALIFLAVVFKILGIPDLFIGFYTGPIAIIAGGAIMIFNSNAD